MRHNLSLNKCFEKIEKPATNGSQRKGCLWAMNPSKIDKMDEEVQKWSKKDKSAIRKSMICPGKQYKIFSKSLITFMKSPETLDALERGELASGIRSASDAESEEEGWDYRALGIKVEAEEEDEEDDDEEEEDEDDDEELDIDSKAWANGISAKTSSGEEYDTDISFTDFNEIEIDVSFYSDHKIPN